MRLRGSFGFCSRGIGSNVRESNRGFRSPSTLAQPYLNPPEPTFLSGPYKFHIRVYNKNRQKSRVW